MTTPRPESTFLVVLGTAQDGGSPPAHAGPDHPAHVAGERRTAAALGLLDHRGGGRWMIDATPDFREQAWRLTAAAEAGHAEFRLDGLLLTHAHIGHYTGLVFLGHESMGASGVPVHVMPRMQAFLEQNEPWRRLVEGGTIELRPLEADEPVMLTPTLGATPLLVPHRDELSETVAFRIQGPRHRALYVPDIDSWGKWDERGHSLEEELAAVDVAYLDGTFFDDDEVPGRDGRDFPHPRILETIDRLAAQPLELRSRVRFIHLNHTNPAQWPGTAARRRIEDAGMAVATEGERRAL